MSEYTEKLIVYAGKFITGFGKEYCEFFLVEQGDGNHADRLGERMAFAPGKAVGNKLVGGMYTGAKFNGEGSVIGLNNAKFYGKWKDQEQLIKWQMRNKETEAEKAAKKVAQDSSVDELEKILLPLRKLYDKYYQMRRPDLTRQLRHAVVNALQVPPRQKED